MAPDQTQMNYWFRRDIDGIDFGPFQVCSILYKKGRVGANFSPARHLIQLIN